MFLNFTPSGKTPTTLVEYKTEVILTAIQFIMNEPWYKGIYTDEIQLDWEAKLSVADAAINATCLTMLLDKPK